LNHMVLPTGTSPVDETVVSRKRGGGQPPRILDRGWLTERLALTVDETAAALGLSRPTIWRMIRRGELQSVKVGGRRLIPVAALRALLGLPDAEGYDRAS
jgi:excisionase family DNA binding protein